MVMVSHTMSGEWEKQEVGAGGLALFPREFIRTFIISSDVKNLWELCEIKTHYALH